MRNIIIMLIVTGTVHVEPSELARFYADLQALAITVRQRAGNLSHGMAVVDPQAGRLLIAERRQDQAAHTAHLEVKETVAFVQRWQHIMRGDIRKYDASNGCDQSH